MSFDFVLKPSERVMTPSSHRHCACRVRWYFSSWAITFLLFRWPKKKTSLAYKSVGVIAVATMRSASNMFRHIHMYICVYIHQAHIVSRLHQRSSSCNHHDRRFHNNPPSQHDTNHLHQHIYIHIRLHIRMRTYRHNYILPLLSSLIARAQMNVKLNRWPLTLAVNRWLKT